MLVTIRLRQGALRVEGGHLATRVEVLVACSLCDRGGFVVIDWKRMACPRCIGRTWLLSATTVRPLFYLEPFPSVLTSSDT